MASKAIKGITIELNGDTTGLDKAIDKINKPAGSTKVTPIKKLHNSPTPLVVDCIALIKFLIKHTVTPETGPNVKDAIKAGNSEISNLM